MSAGRRSSGPAAHQAVGRARLRASGHGREAAACECLVADVAELCGAQRVLLVLDADEGPRIAGSLLPRRETAPALLDAVTPWLNEARRSGKARLRHGPEGAEKRDQRSCIVAPLNSGHDRLGFV